MPEVPAYSKGFNLTSGMNLGGYVLKSVDIQHQSIVRYREYNYPTEMVWEKQDRSDLNTFKSALIQQVSTPRTIYTSYGNPYMCNFGPLQFVEKGNSVIVTSTGHCSRTFT